MRLAPLPGDHLLWTLLLEISVGRRGAIAATAAPGRGVREGGGTSAARGADARRASLGPTERRKVERFRGSEPKDVFGMIFQGVAGRGMREHG